jgi:hypothetical protein
LIHRGGAARNNGSWPEYEAGFGIVFEEQPSSQIPSPRFYYTAGTTRRTALTEPLNSVDSVMATLHCVVFMLLFGVVDIARSAIN